MNKLFIALAVGVMSMFASATPISLTSVGFASGAFVATGNASVPTSLTFSSNVIGGLLNCSGPSAILCAPNGVQAVGINNTLFDSGGASSVFQLGLGLNYTTDSVWSTTGNLSSGLTVFTSGTYCSPVPGFTCSAGVLNFSLQAPSDGTSQFGKYNFSASGTTTPEPGPSALIGTALIGLVLIRRKFMIRSR